MENLETTEGEIWQAYREDQKLRRLERLRPRTEEILALTNLGYKVKQFTPYHFRIDDLIDVFPIHNRYHKLIYNKRGGYRNVTEFIKKSIKK